MLCIYFFLPQTGLKEIYLNIFFVLHSLNITTILDEQCDRAFKRKNHCTELIQNSILAVLMHARRYRLILCIQLLISADLV